MSQTNGAPRKPPVEKELPIGSVKPTPHNARKRFDKDELAELAETIAVHGILQPLLVWQPKPGSDSYELLAGERRLRAGKIAGLETVPCKILQVDAKQAREIGLIENVQRKDLTLLEFADDCAALIDEHGYTCETLGEKIGKSPSTVRGLVKTARQLPKIARAALDTGRIAPSTAGVIARVPGEAARDECARYVLAGSRGGAVPKDSHLRTAEKQGTPALTFTAVKELVARLYMQELKTAPFSLKDTALLPKAGSCETCPYRTGNNPDEYPDSRADICTEPSCYKAKVQAHGHALAAKHKEAGREVLSAAESRKLFCHYDRGQLDHAARDKYVDLGDVCYEVSGNKGWKGLVGKQLESEIVVAVDEESRVHELVPKAKALEVLKRDHGVKTRTVSDTKWEREARVQEAKERARAKVGKVAALNANAAMAAAVQSLLQRAPSMKGLVQLRALVSAAAEITWSNACRQVRMRRGNRDKVVSDRDNVSAIARLASGCTSYAELLGLLAELLAARVTLDWGHQYYDHANARADAGEMFFKEFGIDKKQLMKDAAQQLRKRGKQSADVEQEEEPSHA